LSIQWRLTSISRLKSEDNYSEQKRQKNAPFVDDALKTRGNIYLNVETSLLFVPPYQNFWLRAWFTLGSFRTEIHTENLIIQGFHVALRSHANRSGSDRAKRENFVRKWVVRRKRLVQRFRNFFWSRTICGPYIFTIHHLKHLIAVKLILPNIIRSKVWQTRLDTNERHEQNGCEIL